MIFQGISEFQELILTNTWFVDYLLSVNFSLFIEFCLRLFLSIWRQIELFLEFFSNLLWLITYDSVEPSDNPDPVVLVDLISIWGQCILMVLVHVCCHLHITWNPWNISFRHVLFYEKIHFLIFGGSIFTKYD